MKPPPFAYARPATLDAAVRLLASDEDAKVLAGGQSLVPMMNFRLARPSLLVDIGLLRELETIHRDADTLVVGAGVRQLTAERSETVREACPLIAKALHHVGHRQIRARGTVGGSLAHADPASELCAVAVALDAQLVAVGSGGERIIPAAEFFIAPYTTALAADEILTAVRFPAITHGRTAFAEVARRSGDFALTGVAVAVVLDRNHVASVRLAGMGIGGTVQRLSDSEQAMAGRPLTPETVAEGARVAAASVNPRDDLHADAGTRRAALSAMVERALLEVSR